MNYNKIRKMDISNGPGVRITLFVQGCTFNCKECFNPETHDFKGGKLFSLEEMEKLLTLAQPDYIQGLSILGGEPLHPLNIETVSQICSDFKKVYPDKTIWIWSGFKYEDILKRDNNFNLFENVDVLVDGQFEIDKKDITLKYAGSKNQRVIDIKASNLTNNVVLFKP